MWRSIVVASAIGSLRWCRYVVGRSPRRRVLFVVAVAAVLGALLGGVLRLAWPEPALAASCGAAYGQDEASDGYHAGMRSSQMTIEDYATTCIEVDSIGLLGPNAAFIEIGSDHDGPSVENCAGTGYNSSPYLFIARANQTGAFFCKQPSGESVTPWTKEGFSVDDQDQSGYYTFAHNGHDFTDPFPFLDWTKGTTVTNSERHSAADSAWGHFEATYYMSVTQGWNVWDNNAYCYLNGNNNGNTPFFQQIWSPSNVTVSTGSQVCP